MVDGIYGEGLECSQAEGSAECGEGRKRDVTVDMTLYGLKQRLGEYVSETC